MVQHNAFIEWVALPRIAAIWKISNFYGHLGSSSSSIPHMRSAQCCWQHCGILLDASRVQQAHDVDLTSSDVVRCQQVTSAATVVWCVIRASSLFTRTLQKFGLPLRTARSVQRSEGLSSKGHLSYRNDLGIVSRLEVGKAAVYMVFYLVQWGNSTKVYLQDGSPSCCHLSIDVSTDRANISGVYVVFLWSPLMVIVFQLLPPTQCW